MTLKLDYEKIDTQVLPEILSILEEMIRVYNDWEGPTFIKLWPVKAPVEGSTSSRYVAFTYKDQLRTAILINCPASCTLIEK
jgi:hypothetical protein